MPQITLLLLRMPYAEDYVQKITYMHERLREARGRKAEGVSNGSGRSASAKRQVTGAAIND